MTTPTPLPLDAAAKVKKAREELAGLCSGERKFTMCVPVDRERDTDMVISDALDVAEALAARVAELERELNGVREASASELSTAYKRVAELERELADGNRVALDLRDEADKWRITANALRDALEDVLHNAECACCEDGEPTCCDVCAARYMDARATLIATPAASLAAYRKSVLECLPSGKSLHDWMRNRGWVVTLPEADELASAIRALAAQAQGVYAYCAVCGQPVPRGECDGHAPYVHAKCRPVAAQAQEVKP